MTSPPTVSVIIPVFNAAAYVVRAIESALNQTWTDSELIVVNDGSTDESATLIKNLAARDARVRLFEQPNGGLANARNRAMREARGRLFALLDSDDEWMPDYLETQLGVLTRDPAVSVVTANVLERGGPSDGQPYWPASDALCRLRLIDLIRREDSVCIMSVFRREVPDAIGGFDETFLRGNEDYDFWLRAAGAGFVFVQQRRPLGFYQRRPDSMSASQLNMLQGIGRALGKARAAVAPQSPERDAIDRQLARFAEERVACEAALALRRGDFDVAAERFGALYATRGGPRLALIAAWSRYAPASLLRVDAFRRSIG